MLKQTISRKFSILLIASLALITTACGTNPVTKKKEIQFVSQNKKLKLANKITPLRGNHKVGDYIIDPELTEYVQGIGKRLGAVSDCPDLPYEFVVINDSTPTLGRCLAGKIAFNRGLLYELNSEAELAAVMGHEIVHAAARHGAKSMERGVFMQGAMIAVGIGCAK